MIDGICAQVRGHLQRVLAERRPAPLAPDLYAHVASCAACRGALALLAANTLGLRPPPPIDCSACQRDLAAFIDLERAEGAVAAIGQYPAVWWHIWTCEVCAEVYGLARDLVALEPLELPDLSAPPLLMAMPIRRILAYVPRADIAMVLPGARELRSVWRGGDHPITIIDDEPFGDLQISLVAQRQRTGQWSLRLAAQPEPAGWLVMTLGHFSSRALFGSDGRATVADVPPELLLDDEGPDLELVLEHEQPW